MIAKKANHFYNSLIQKYSLNKPKTIDYYLANSVDQLGELLGFDYFGAGVTSGVTSVINGYIMSCKTPFHAHELVHFAFYQKSIKRNFLIEEGCAEFLGSRLFNSKNYKINMHKLCIDIEKDPDYAIENLIGQSDKIPWKGYNYKYPFGALLCQMVYDKGGTSGLRKLMFTNTKNTDQLISTLADILDFKNKKQLFKAIKKKAIGIAEN